MITKQQAIEAREFHAGTCTRKFGPRGGVTTKIIVWRRNGKTQTWKRSPEKFRVPIKYGLYGFDAFTERDAEMFHVPEECPLLKKETTDWADARCPRCNRHNKDCECGDEGRAA